MITGDPREDLIEFFTLVWGKDTNGLVYLPVIMEDGNVRKTWYKWPVHQDFVVKHVLANAENSDVYFSPVLWKEPRIAKDAVLHTNVVWVDVDGKVPDTWDPVPPNIIVQSSRSNKIHTYWSLSSPITDPSVAESINRSLAYKHDADPSGWDIEQLLRPPYTINHGRNLPTVLRKIEHVYSTLEEFGELPKVKAAVYEAIDDSDLPDMVGILGKYSWDEDTLELLQKDMQGRDRSDALMRIGFRCAELGLTDTESFAVLLHMDDRIGKFKGRSDRKKRLTAIIVRAKTKYPKPLPVAEELTVSSTEEEVKYSYKFKEFVTEDIKVEWAIDNLMEKGGCGLIVADPGVGKSQLLMQLGLRHVLGKSILGFDFPGPATGVLFSLEMSITGTHRLLSTMARDFTEEELDALERGFTVVPRGESMILGRKGSGATFFESILKETTPDFILIDSLQMVLDGGPQDDIAVKELFAYLGLVKKYFGCYIWIVHHQRKQSQDSSSKAIKTISDVFGSVYITANTDTIIALSKNDLNNPKAGLTLRQVKNRYAEEGTCFSIWRTDNLSFTREDLSGGTELGSSAPAERPANRTANNGLNY